MNVLLNSDSPDKLIKATPVDLRGRPTAIIGSLKWSAGTPGIVSIFPNDNGTVATITPLAAGVTFISVEDNSSGKPLTRTFTVTVTAAPAVDIVFEELL